MDASVIYAIDPAEVVQVHIDWQDRYADELVRPLARGVIRDVVSQFQVEQVVTSKRNEMIDQISINMEQKLGENGLKLVDFILRGIGTEAKLSRRPFPVGRVLKCPAVCWSCI